MFKKIALIAIVMAIFITGNLLASEGPVGLYLTVMTACNPEPYVNQLVYVTIDGVTQDKYTDENGQANFGWLAASGIYYIETVIDDETYSTTVEKIAGIPAYKNWHIQLLLHDEE